MKATKESKKEKVWWRIDSSFDWVSKIIGSLIALYLFNKWGFEYGFLLILGMWAFILKKNSEK